MKTAETAGNALHNPAMTIRSHPIDDALVGRLIVRQFPGWADLPVRRVLPGGTDNRTFRLGDRMLVRLPSSGSYAAQVEKEQYWLPRLAPQLPLPIPEPLAMGEPTDEYPWAWSIYRWIEGESGDTGMIDDLSRCAADIADFLLALQKIDPECGPQPGAHNFFRGGPLSTYDDETRTAIASLRHEVDHAAATRLWERALDTSWEKPPVWVHGDMEAKNILVAGGHPVAVIDFGSSATGDPSCDLSIAWTLFRGESRRFFRARLGVDDDTWMRGAAWVLWKGLITLEEHRRTDPTRADEARRIIEDVLRAEEDHSPVK